MSATRNPPSLTFNSDHFDGAGQKHFIYRRSIKTSDINKIMYKPTWIFGDKMRSIYIIDKEKGEIKIRMSNAAYPHKTLARVVTDLIRTNPSIELDAETKNLLKECA